MSYCLIISALVSDAANVCMFYVKCKYMVNYIKINLCEVFFILYLFYPVLLRARWTFQPTATCQSMESTLLPIGSSIRFKKYKYISAKQYLKE